jgi:hypothetical protein
VEFSENELFGGVWTNSRGGKGRLVAPMAWAFPSHPWYGSFESATHVPHGMGPSIFPMASVLPSHPWYGVEESDLTHPVWSVDMGARPWGGGVRIEDGRSWSRALSLSTRQPWHGLYGSASGRVLGMVG